jgi:hypothetical protein
MRGHDDTVDALRFAVLAKRLNEPKPLRLEVFLWHAAMILSWGLMVMGIAMGMVWMILGGLAGMIWFAIGQCWALGRQSAAVRARLLECLHLRARIPLPGEPWTLPGSLYCPDCKLNIPFWRV